MAIYSRRSQLSWEEYLRADAFVRTASGIARMGAQPSGSISSQTSRVIASSAAIAAISADQLTRINAALETGLEETTCLLDYIGSGIDRLRSAFTYGLGLVVAQLRANQDMLQTVIDQLDDIHRTLKSPLLTDARELFNIGMHNLERGFLREALDRFLQSEEKNSTNFFVHLQIGNLYLYGLTRDDDTVDLSRAERHFLLAARYAKGEVPFLQGAAKLCSEAYLQAAIVAYARSNKQWSAGNLTNAAQETKKALSYTSKAIEFFPEFWEAHYHHAKFLALLGNAEEAVEGLRVAILADRNYCLKADSDGDFDGIRNAVSGLLESLREGAQRAATELYESLKLASLDKAVIPREEMTHFRLRFEQAMKLYHEDTYFGYLDAIQCFNDANGYYVIACKEREQIAASVRVAELARMEQDQWERQLRASSYHSSSFDIDDIADVVLKHRGVISLAVVAVLFFLLFLAASGKDCCCVY